MSTSNPNNPNDDNTGVSNELNLQTILSRPVSVSSPINQIRGISAATSTGAGIPKQVTNLSASMATASKGTTSSITVQFHRDPSDSAFGGVNVYIKGYQGNNQFVQVGGGIDSPVTFVLNNTGEGISIAVQATGNSGSAPLTSSPTTGAKLPKGTNGGFGSTTVVTPPSGGGGTTPVITEFFGPGVISPGGALLGNNPTVAGVIGTTINQVSVFRFSLPAQITISQITAYVTSAHAGHFFNVGIYDVNGNKLVDSGAMNCGSANTVVSVSITPVQIGPGEFYLAQSVDTTTGVDVITFQPSAGFGANPEAFYNQRSIKYGQAANSTSAGVLPATLGVVSASGVLMGAVCALFEA
jgi:hypothetical protein